MPTESVKNDRKDNKVMMELLPWPELEEIAKVFTAGAKKYGPNRWQNLPDGYERYKGAMLRHLTEVEKGNAIDTDTGCMHAAQVAVNAIFMLHFKMKEAEQSKEDKKMTPEEFIQSKVINDNGYEHHSCEMVAKADALRAIDMARNEKTNTVGMQGWICPKCGRVYSPYTSMCSHCGNVDNFKITCKL